ALLVFSVGGGNVEKNVSVNLVRAIDEARARGARVFGIVGKDGGYTRKASQTCVVIPVVSPDRITPHTEGLCAVIWHLIVSHPALKVAQTKWEAVDARASGTTAGEPGGRMPDRRPGDGQRSRGDGDDGYRHGDRARSDLAAADQLDQGQHHQKNERQPVSIAEKPLQKKALMNEDQHERERRAAEQN